MHFDEVKNVLVSCHIVELSQTLVDSFGVGQRHGSQVAVGLIHSFGLTLENEVVHFEKLF